MISFLSHRIAHFLYQNHTIDAELVPVCQYGLEIIISTGIGFSLVILAGLIMGYMKEAFLFYFLFIIIRFYTGGYHAETHFKCKVTLLLCFFTVLLCFILLQSKYCIQIHIALEAFYLIIVLLFAPVEHLNAPMTKDEAKKNRIIAIAMAIGLFIFTTFIICSHIIKVAAIIALTQTIVAILIIISKVLGVKTNEQSQGENS